MACGENAGRCGTETHYDSARAIAGQGPELGCQTEDKKSDMPPKIASIPAGGGAPGESSLRSLNCSTLFVHLNGFPRLPCFLIQGFQHAKLETFGLRCEQINWLRKVWIFGILHLRSTIFRHNSTHLSLKTSEASNSTQLPHLVVQVGCRP